VLGPDTHLAVEIKAATEGAGVMWCDGRRHVDLPPGARIEVRRGLRPLRLARLTSAPFTDRLVAKFDLSVAGWRGNGDGVAPVDATEAVDGAVGTPALDAPGANDPALDPADDVDGGVGARP
jgi:NAD+ kinase